MEARGREFGFAQSGLRVLGAAMAVFFIAMVLTLAGASTALATHKVVTNEEGAPYSKTIHITAATKTLQKVQYTGLKMDYLDGTQYRARQTRVINDTDYMVYMNCYVRASDDKTTVKWLIGDVNDGTTSGWDINGEGTNTVGLVTGTYLSPGDSMFFDAVSMSANHSMSDTTVDIQINYKYGGEVKLIQTKKPIVTATKLASNKVEVNVKYSGSTDQGISGVSRIDLYQGKTKVKSWKSNAQNPVRTWTGKTKAAVKAKYKVVSTTIENPKDTITSDVVKAQANVLTLTSKKPKLKNFEDYSAEFVPSKLSYSGKKLVIEGWTVNTFGMKYKYPLTVQVSIPSKQISYYSNWQYNYAKGVKKVKLTVKASKVVNLRAGNVHVQ